ncbi:RNA-guided endonuclease IscB [uncultured Methanobrevibacter sp.]|uniref:RNA-guided endonuclease IscB n=1 Tax=uncultured Methanobrevibacter sp. TaxID=253161 RepID=UPI00263097BB|nr:RNA-guided endonuclease IscB [uncultured Methanobrevibacter sp.]
MLVYVLNKNGEALMPCKPRKARLLLKECKAKVVNRTPFTIQLLYGSSGYRQPVNLGVDAGSRYIGLSATTQQKELFKATVELRQDIPKLLESRRILRRSRRNRKLRYRPARFNNRGRKGKLAPSIQHKIDSHLTIIKKVCGFIPVKNIIVETAEFDPHKLKNPNIQGSEYQHGDEEGFYNVKAAVLSRDNYTCQICGAQHVKLQVHHIRFKSHGGSDSMENLTTLCKECHEKIHNNELKFNKKVKSFQHAAHMNTMRKKLVELLKNEFDNVFETYGYLTKYNREKLDISKSHCNDAYVISHNYNAKQSQVEYLYRKVRRHNRQIHKTKPGKGGIRKRNQSPYIVNGFRRFDKVLYNGIECFITGKRSSGYFQLKRFDGTVVSQGVSSKKLKLLEPIKGWLIAWRLANSSPT